MPEGPNLDDLLSVWQRANDDGRPLSAEELCADCPELLPELQRRIEVLERLDGLTPRRTNPNATIVDSNGRGGGDGGPPPLPINGPPGYELLGLLGRGGMGVVYKARQVGLNRPVALKMILGGAHAGEEERLRFLAEAEVVASLHHPGIVQVHDFGTHDGVPYFVLEYCSGGSLDDHLAGRPLPPQVAATLIEQLAFAVQAAHDKGIVHRDLKPANVLIWDPNGNRLPPLTAATTLKITDFGLARRVLETGRGLTRPNAVMGTPSYMSPEQARSAAAAGEASDLYALGAILYELLTGRPPFLADTPQETLVQVANHEPASVRSLQPGVPRDLETICLKCLNKDPARRYDSARALAHDLRRFLRGEPVHARPTGHAERAWRWCRRHPDIVALAGTLAGLTVAALITIWALYLDAARERDRARRQEKLAQEERDLARGERNRAEVLLYASLLTSAQREMERGNHPLALRHLDACRWDLRGWEHRLLYSAVGSSRVDLQACKLEYSIVSPK